MPIEITMPRLSDTMETGTIIKWNVKEGDAVSSGDVVADVETDKATMELSAFDDGTMAKIVVEEGKQVDVGTVIALLAAEGEDVESVASQSASGNGRATADAEADSDDQPEQPQEREQGETQPAAASEPDRPADDRESEPEPEPQRGGKMRVSPVARRLAEEHDIDLRLLRGSGPSGRIIKRDVLKAAEAQEENAASVPPSAGRGRDRAIEPHEQADQDRDDRARVPTTPVPMRSGAGELAATGGLQSQRVPLSNMRQTIARRLVEAKTTIPHYQVSMTFQMDELMELRKTLNEQLAPMNVKLSVNDFLVRACALAMHAHPEVNASWDGDALSVHGDVNIGVAIAVGPEKGGGLVVATVRHADQRSLRSISAEAKALSEKARTRGLSVEDMADSTFTVSNLGMYGVEHFTAIINPPNSAILAAGAAIQKPVVRDGELAVGWEMTATLSSDHRVIDGAMAAEYMQTVKRLIEHPAALMV